jgi:hypothetical protein
MPPKEIAAIESTPPIYPPCNAVKMRKLAGEKDKRRAEEPETSGVTVYHRV